MIIIIAGIFAEIFVRSELTVSGNAELTANNIAGNESLWRIGFAGHIIMLICDVGVTVILYVLLKQINKNIGLIAAAFRLVSIAIMGINGLNHFAVLFLIGGGDYLSAFSPQELNGFIMLLLKAHAQGYNTSLAFFGFHCLFLGYLLYKAEYFPKILGIFIIICGLYYEINSFSWFLNPEIAKVLFTFILVPCFIAELSLCLWLMIKGIKEEEWRNKFELKQV